MSIKDLFGSTDKTREYLGSQTEKDAFQEIESSRNMQEIARKQDTYLPNVDYSKPESFAKFGSAYLYYKAAIERIINFYPYDGSDAEINRFYNQSLDIEKYIFNNMYPRTTGYVLLSADGYGTVSKVTGSGYGVPTTDEYITFFGGPNVVSADLTLKQMIPDFSSSNLQYNNVYDDSIYTTEGLISTYGQGTRESNLKSNFDTGVTIEFWAKTGSVGSDPTETTKQVIFDMWNNVNSSSADYARITVELTGGAGSAGANASAQMVFREDVTKALLEDDKFILTDWAGTSQEFTINITDDVVTGGSIGLLSDTTINDIASSFVSAINNIGALDISAEITEGTADLKHTVTLTQGALGPVGNTSRFDGVSGSMESIGCTTFDSCVTISNFAGGAIGMPLLITAQSGNLSSSAQSVFTSSIGQNLDFSDWKQYSIVLYNTGSDFEAKLYVNGHLNDVNTYSDITINELQSKNMMGRVGALLTAPSASADASGMSHAGAGASDWAGAGKLSGSLDEFRFWEVARNASQVSRHWFTQIRGGVNTDISNASLGMYYKFNEGITGDNTVDSNVLDYGGRLCNGTWTGYTSNSRNTGSAIVSASAAIKEYLDPIIYEIHPDVSTLKTNLLNSGSYHDGQNAALFANQFPTWIIEEEDAVEDGNLQKLSHIVGAYFDKLHLQISAVPQLKHDAYPSASADPLPFARHLPQSLGLYTPDLFIDATLPEKFLNRSDTALFEGDLHELKNLIYTNLYNNLANIYKAKGTERAIKNIFRCFYLSDDLVNYSVYANNQLYELRNNLQQTLKKRSYANFNEQTNIHGVIYQAEDPHIATTRAYISSSGTGPEPIYGMTAEVGVVFPRFIRSLDSFRRDFTQISLFGMHSASVHEADNTTIYSSDEANFQVYAVRDTEYSTNVYFKLESGTDPWPLPILTSSTFLNVYNNENWTFSVRIKPNNYPVSTLVSSSNPSSYDVIFAGYNNQLGTVQNSFSATGSISVASGSNFLQASKRLCAGAYNTNITGATNIYPSDVKVSTARYWLKYIDDYALKQHVMDPENVGISGSYMHISALDSGSSPRSYNFNALALDWYFGNVTGSDSAGTFYVSDLSSGSALVRDNFGWMGEVGGHLHTGKAVGFKTSSEDVVKRELVNEFKFISPERVVSSDQVQILSLDDEVFGTAEQIPDYIYTLEKSMYGAVSEQILDFFAGAADFHNLIGEPVNRYRMRYKSIEYLRRIFFEKFQSIQTVEKFTEYYKWFDDALALIIKQLVPASSGFVGDVYNTVESHVLERNKYNSQYPTLEFKPPEIEARATSFYGSSEGLEDFPAGAASYFKAIPDWELDLWGGLEESPRDTKEHGKYWKRRAIPAGAGTGSYEIATGDISVDRARQRVRETGYALPVKSGSAPVLKTAAGATYRPNKKLANQLGGTYSFRTSKILYPFKGGVNFDSAKRIGYAYSALYPAGPVYAPSGGVFIPQNVMVGFTEDLVPLDPLKIRQERLGPSLSKKAKRVMTVNMGRDYTHGEGYSEVLKNTAVFPFNLVSSSVKSGYSKRIATRVSANLDVVNLHNDVYGDDMEVPLQGPFTNYAVGGHQSRHIAINKGTDSYLTRPEAWKLLLGKCPDTSGAIGLVPADYPWPEANEVGENPYPMTGAQKATYYRDMVAKRPVNIRNIHLRSGSTILGNYRKNYEILHTVGSYSNPRNFVKSQSAISFPPSAFQNTATSSTQLRTFLDIHRGTGWLRAHDTDAPAYTGYTGSHFEFMGDYSIGYLTKSTGTSIIRSKFSNPGGLDTSPAGYRDFRGNEFAVYNATPWRNLSVIKPSQGPSGTLSEPTGAGGPGIRVSDIHGYDYGLRSQLARHTARFGRDSLWVTGTTAVFRANDPRSGAPGSHYNQLPGFHKVHRNNFTRPRICGTDTTAVYTGTFLVNTASLYFGDQTNRGVCLISADSQSAPNLLTASRADGITYAGWVRFSPDENQGDVFSVGRSKAGDDPLLRIYKTYTAAEHRLNLQVRTRNTDSGTGATALGWLYAASSDLDDGNWHHIAVAAGVSVSGQADSDDVHFYLDGTRMTMVTGTAFNTYFDTNIANTYNVRSKVSVINGEGIYCFGGGSSETAVGIYPFTGAMDQLTLWTTRLTEEEISGLYNSGIPCDVTASDAYTNNPAKLFAWYLLGEVPENPAQADAVNSSNPGIFSSGSNSFFNNHLSGSENNMFPIGYSSTTIDTLQISTVEYPTPIAGCSPSLSHYEETDIICRSNEYDNFFVKHQIPRSDRQYAWITGAISQSTDYRYYGFMPIEGPLMGRYSSSIGGIEPYFPFLSASDFGSYNESGDRYWGIDKRYESSIYKQFIPESPAGLNTNVYENVSGAINTVGPPSDNITAIRNVHFARAINTEGYAAFFNALMFHRGNIYGWGTFNQTRQGNHPILRHERKNNKLSMVVTGNVLNSYDLRPLSLKGRAVYVNYDYDTTKIVGGVTTTKTDNVTVRTSYNNELIYFNQPQLNAYLNINPHTDNEVTSFEQLMALRAGPAYNLNWVHYRECVYPALKNEFWSGSSFRSTYDNKYWRNSLVDRIALGNTLSNSLGIWYAQADDSGDHGPRLTQSSWPLDAPSDFLTRTGPPYLSLNGATGAPIQYTLRASASSGELQNTYGWCHYSGTMTTGWPTTPLVNRLTEFGVYIGCTSPGALYARKQTLASPISVMSPGQISGARNPGSYEVGFEFSPYADGVQAGHNASTGSGEAYWDAPATAGYLTGTVDENNVTTIGFVSAASEPWFNSYDDFKADLKLKARGYSVIPEFRISEKVEDYLRPSVKRTFDTFDIPGTDFNSSQEDFYLDFSNSDFMKNFLDVRKMSDLSATEFKLTCRAAIRFNPYKGFYPAQRTLDLVSEFSRSYGNDILVGNDSIPNVVSGAQSPFARMVYQPLFAPGILFNSIKSGIACDWPLVTDAEKLGRYNYSGSAASGSTPNWAFYPRWTQFMGGTKHVRYPTPNDAKISLSSSFFDVRLPFEAIVNPTKYMAGLDFIDMEPDPSVTFAWPEEWRHSGSIKAGFVPASTGLYDLMASNFVAEVGNFFLKDQEYTKLAPPGLFSSANKFKGTEVFAARLRLKNSFQGQRTYQFESGASGDNKYYSLYGARAFNSSSMTYRVGSNNFYTWPAGTSSEPGSPITESATVTDEYPAFTFATRSFEIPQDPQYNSGFKRNFVMYSRTTAFGPPFAGRVPETASRAMAASSLSVYAGMPPYDYVYASRHGTRDCFNGYNWAYTPPHQHGEAWVDFIFRPSGNVDYDLERILQETRIVKWRFDPGPRIVNIGTPTQKRSGHSLVSATTYMNGHNQNQGVYSGKYINDNSMHLDDSVNLFGVENVYRERVDKFGNKILEENEIVGKRWVIQPKFETPMLNFADVGVHPVTGNIDIQNSAQPSVGPKTVPVSTDYGRDTAANGMWHQFGILPDSETKGIFLEIGDIPSTWLDNHYMVVSESSAYNEGVLLLDDEGQTVAEANQMSQRVQSFTKLMGFEGKNSSVRLGEVAPKKVIKEAVVVVPYIIDYVDPIISNKSTLGQYARIEKKKFITIPTNRYEAALREKQGSAAGDSLDAAGVSIRNLVQKMEQYVLPQQFDFLQNPLVEPIVMYMFEFKYELDQDDLSYIWQNIAPRDYKKMSFQTEAVAHELFNTELLTEQNLMENPDLRWMVFKVKQKSQAEYKDMVARQASEGGEKLIIPPKTGYPIRYNWPYDYLSIVELVKIDAEVLYKGAPPKEMGQNIMIDSSAALRSSLANNILTRRVRNTTGSFNVDIENEKAKINTKKVEKASKQVEIDTEAKALVETKMKKNAMNIDKTKKTSEKRTKMIQQATKKATEIIKNPGKKK